jgi:hypothetical protein
MSDKREKKNAVQKSQAAHPVVSITEQDGVSAMPQEVGQDLSRDGTGTRVATDETTTAIVPTAGKFTTVRSSANQGIAKTLDSVIPRHEEKLAVRACDIDAHYAGDSIDVNLPPQIIETAQRWLRANNLIWSSNDPSFWNALVYVLDSLESFSIDAVEQALIICTTEKTNSPVRRGLIYSELKACRAIKKLRDLRIRIRTAEVVAKSVLIPSLELQKILPLLAQFRTAFPTDETPSQEWWDYWFDKYTAREISVAIEVVSKDASLRTGSSPAYAISEYLRGGRNESE